MIVSPNMGLNIPEGSDVFDYKKYLKENLEKIDENFMNIPLSEEFTATEGQTVFNLASSYTVGNNSISVEVDGVPQELGTGFTESSPTSITLSEGVPAGAVVSVNVFKTPAGINAKIAELTTQLSDHAVNVKAFGAKGDGINDDTTAIQNAINDAVANLKSLFFPHGKYKITSGLTVQYTDNTRWQPGIRIYGVAPGMSQDGTRYGSILAPTNAVTGPALSVIGTANTDNSYKGMANGTVVENLGILGVNGGTNGDGFYFKYFVNLTIRNCWSMYNQNGFTFDRQANGATFGYGFGVTLDRIFAVSNRGWGIDALDAGSINLTMLDPTLQSNTLGGITAAGGPIICQAGGFYGNGGPAVRHDEASGVSAIFGPHFYGTRFETNNTSTLGPQVELIAANMPVFDACWFLTSTEGEHGIKMGEDAVKIVYRPTLRNCHFGGRLSVTSQNAYIIGNNCQGALIENCRELNYTTKFGGTAGLKADILYIEAGNQFGNPVNVVRNGVSRTFASMQTGDVQPRFSINSNGDHTWGDGTNAIDVSLSRETANRLTLAAGDTLRITDGTWNGGNLILGAYRLWIDGTGKLRLKSGAPTSDTDGTVVGTQV